MKILPFSILVLVAGCASVGPDFQRPAMQLPTAFAEGGAQLAPGLAARAWWSDYRDPTLDGLIRTGLSQDLSIEAAYERIAAARAELRGAGVLNSQLTGTATAARQRGSVSDGPVTYTSSKGLDAAFVLDLFGGARRAREGAAAEVASAEADVQVVRLAWLAEVVAAYADARYNQEALALTRSTLDARARTVEITRGKLNAGAASELDLVQAEALLETARADMPGYEAQFNANVFRLATLLNEPAAPLLGRMQRGAAMLRTPKGAGTGVPADLLRNRPDVRKAEHALAAATAQVGVATASLLPSISLAGQITDTAGAQTWGFGPQISLPLLNQGALQATRTKRISEARQAEIAWRAQIMTAVQDVQTAQSNLRRYRQQAARLSAAASAYERALKLAQTNYQEGAISLLDLLDADRSAVGARMAVASARNTASKEWATLQIATGAGAGTGNKGETR